MIYEAIPFLGAPSCGVECGTQHGQSRDVVSPTTKLYIRLRPPLALRDGVVIPNLLGSGRHMGTIHVPGRVMVGMTTIKKKTTACCCTGSAPGTSPVIWLSIFGDRERRPLFYEQLAPQRFGQARLLFAECGVTFGAGGKRRRRWRRCCRWVL